MTSSLGICKQNMFVCSFKLFKWTESVTIKAWVVFSIEKDGRYPDPMKLPSSLSLIVVLFQSMETRIVAEERDNGPLIHVHHAKAVFIELLREICKFLIS